MRGEDSPHIWVFADSDVLGGRIATSLGVPISPVRVHTFPDGEVLVTCDAEVPGGAIVVRSLHHPNAKLFELALAADALRRAGARHLTLVAPYLPYMRQDAVFSPGQPLSQAVLGRQLAQSFDRVIAVEPHLHRVPTLHEAIPVEASAVSAAPVIATWLRTRGANLVVGPDAESAPWVCAIAERARVPWVVGEKRRAGDREVEIRFPSLRPGARAVIVDDIASSGVTLAVAARELFAAGAATVEVAVVHAIFSAGAEARIRSAGVLELVSCDTVPHPTNALSVADLIASELGA